VVQLFAIDTVITLRNLFSVTMDNYLPKSIAFGPMSGETRNVLVFGLHDGHMYVFLNKGLLYFGSNDTRHTLNTKNGKIQDTIQLGCMMCVPHINNLNETEP
jgi:hypothetical protein